MKIMQTMILLVITLLTACTVGPDYKRASVVVPIAYKEAPEGWKIAAPQDDCDRGKWWLIFNDDNLNALEERVNISNQNVKVAEAQYRQALALVNQARAAYFPVLSGSATFTRQQSSAATTPTQAGNTLGSVATKVIKSNPVTNNYNLALNATWEPDIWGLVRRTVESAVDSAQASKSALALTTLSMQGTLAQLYFELRGLDGDQKVLDNSVINYQKLLKITENQYHAGTVSQANILQVKSQLELAQVQAIDNGILRAQYEHAIAVLTGQPPGCFTLGTKVENIKPPFIPVAVPSSLLERRPDIAQAERLMASANAQIGVAIAAYFPTLSLTGIGGYQSSFLKTLFSKPARYWSFAASIAETIFDAGLRSAKVDFARANYDQTVATYRQTVLSAFQDVEDNLVALRILAEEYDKQNQAVQTSKHALKLVVNEYKAGTAQLSDVLIAENTLFTAEKSANDIEYRRMTAAVGLIKALGGGWDSEELKF
jgi:NodT family efflux transporter outer membrane factor (OMF) lipoprotein